MLSIIGNLGSPRRGAGYAAHNYFASRGKTSAALESDVGAPPTLQEFAATQVGRPYAIEMGVGALTGGLMGNALANPVHRVAMKKLPVAAGTAAGLVLGAATGRVRAKRLKEHFDDSTQTPTPLSLSERATLAARDGMSVAAIGAGVGEIRHMHAITKLPDHFQGQHHYNQIPRRTGRYAAIGAGLGVLAGLLQNPTEARTARRIEKDYNTLYGSSY